MQASSRLASVAMIERHHDPRRADFASLPATSPSQINTHALESILAHATRWVAVVCDRNITPLARQAPTWPPRERALDWRDANFMRFAWPTASQRRHRQHAASRQRSAAGVGACKQEYARAGAALARRYTRATGPKFDSFAHFEAWLSGGLCGHAERSGAITQA
jgi:hypothetical protein